MNKIDDNLDFLIWMEKAHKKISNVKRKINSKSQLSDHDIHTLRELYYIYDFGLIETA